MAKFRPGQEKLANSGRKKGTPNRNTQNLFEALKALNFDVPERLVRLLPELAPDKQAAILIDLMSYLYPKRKAVEISDITKSVGPQVIVTLPFNGREQNVANVQLTKSAVKLAQCSRRK